MNVQEARTQVLQYAQQSFTQGLVAATNGNFSLLADDNSMAITPSGINYMTMAVDDVMVIDLDGNILQGNHKPSSEWRMHAQIYKNMPEVRSVVHTHSPYATSFAVLNVSIPVVLVEMIFFLGGNVRVAPLAVQGTDEVGMGCVKALANRGACLLQNHGVVTIGKDLQQAHVRAVYAEDAAKICHMAKAIGTPVEIPEDYIQTVLNR